MCSLAVIFDAIVCYLSKGIDLYGDEDEKAKPPQNVTNVNVTDVNNVDNRPKNVYTKTS